MRAAGSDPKQVTIKKLLREQILAAQAAGLTILNFMDRLQAGLETRPAVETYLLNLPQCKRLIIRVV